MYATTAHDALLYFVLCLSVLPHCTSPYHRGQLCSLWNLFIWEESSRSRNTQLERNSRSSHWKGEQQNEIVNRFQGWEKCLGHSLCNRKKQWMTASVRGNLAIRSQEAWFKFRQHLLADVQHWQPLGLSFLLYKMGVMISTSQEYSETKTSLRWYVK